MTPPRLRSIAAAGGALLLLAGCAAQAEEAGVASLTQASTDVADDAGLAAAAVDSDAAMLAFAQCMRDEGIDFQDPVAGEDGSLQFAPPGDGGAGDVDRDAIRAGFESCGDLIEGLEVGGQGQRGGEDFDAETFLVYAECMRDNGVSEFPDPGADGRPDREAMQALDTESETFTTASATCAEATGFEGRIGGQGGPGGQGGQRGEGGQDGAGAPAGGEA